MVHGRDHITKYQKTTEQIHREITLLYECRDKVQHHDHQLFYDDLTQHLREPLNHLQAWISLNKALILLSVRQSSNQARSKTCT
jgi:predicted nucleic acid-binding OB-fold protein